MKTMGWRCRFFSDGYCRQLEAFAIRRGRFRWIRFPSLMALLEHPDHGAVLFDTGYAGRFLEATASFPYRIYRWITPVKTFPEMAAAPLLEREGIKRIELRHIILSHFHADHMGALKDFSEASIHCTRQGFDSVRKLRGFGALKRAFLPDLLPVDFFKRANFIDDHPTFGLGSSWLPFENGWDLFGDRSLMAIDLPGHAAGQFGLVFIDDGGNPVLLASDACWLSRAYRENLPPQWLGWIPQAQRSSYYATLEKLHGLHVGSPSVRIVPTHCEEVVCDFVTNEGQGNS